MKIEPKLPYCSTQNHNVANGRIQAEYYCDMCEREYCVSCVAFDVVKDRQYCNAFCAPNVRNIIKNKIDEWIIAFEESKVGSRN